MFLLDYDYDYFEPVFMLLFLLHAVLEWSCLSDLGGRLCLSSSWNGSCVPGMGAISDFLILLPRWRLCLSSSGMELWFLEWELFLIFYLLVTRWLSLFLTAWLLLL
jgi:hypothetical protein